MCENNQNTLGENTQKEITSARVWNGLTHKANAILKYRKSQGSKNIQLADIIDEIFHIGFEAGNYQSEVDAYVKTITKHN